MRRKCGGADSKATAMRSEPKVPLGKRVRQGWRPSERATEHFESEGKYGLNCQEEATRRR